MMKTNWILLMCLAAIAVGCRNVNPPSPYVRRATEFRLGYEKCYGRFYDSVPQNVFCLDLYSEGLSLNMKGKMQGTGWNLCLSDVFATDSLLPSGRYVSDTTAAPYTFLPGHDYEGMPNGAYLLYVEDAKVSSITVLTDGGFHMTTVGDTTDIQFYFTRPGYANRVDTIYKAHYRGKLLLSK